MGNDTIEAHLTDTGLISTGTRVELEHEGRSCSLRVCQGYRYEGADSIFLRRETYPWNRYIGSVTAPSSGNGYCSLIDLRTLDIRHLWDEPTAEGADSRTPLLTEAQFIDGAARAACREEAHREATESEASGASAGEEP